MSGLKVEYATSVFAKGYHCEDDVPVVRLEVLKEWIAERVANAGWEGVSGNHWIDAKVLMAEMEAMGK